jgi:membrane protein
VDFVLDNLPLNESRARHDLEVLLLNVTRNVAGFGLLGIATLLFAASGVMGSIRHALNAAFEVEDPRPPAQAKAIDLLLVVAFGATLTLSLALTVAERVTESLSDAVDDEIPGAGGAIAEIVVKLGQLVPLGMAFIVFAVLFRLVPSAYPKLRDTWPGVLLAAVGYEIAKTGFAVYLGKFANYSAIYASLATVIAFLVFVWVAANVALLGAEVAANWPQVRAGAYDDDEGEPLGTRIKGLVRGLFVRT